MVQNSRLKADRLFLTYIGSLVFIGLLALFSASTPVGYAKFHDAYFFIKKQIFNGLIPGIIAGYILSRIDFHFLKKVSWLFYLGSIVLLVLVFIPGVGMVINGSRSWINVFGFSFQPAEAAKLGVIIMLAYLLSQKKYDWSNWQTSLVPVLAVISPAVLLILAQPDIGTLSIVGIVIFAMLFAANVPSRYLAVLFGVGMVALVALILIAPYRASRITTFLHPELDPKGVGYQMNQSFLAVGSGGFWGRGFNNSRQKYQYLPEVSADTIFAIVAEENGFLISSGIIVLILLIVWRGLKIAKETHDQFGALLVTGIVVWFGWQSFLNIGATVGALPLTGVPLPFVSHGGSALATALMASGIVLSVSKESTI